MSKNNRRRHQRLTEVEREAWIDSALSSQRLAGFDVPRERVGELIGAIELSENLTESAEAVPAIGTMLVYVGLSTDGDGTQLQLSRQQALDILEHIRSLRVEADELNQIFDLRHAADIRAIRRWRAANPGKDLVMPDHADLVVWLMDQINGG